LSYGEIAAFGDVPAAAAPPWMRKKLKQRKDFRLIGQAGCARRDLPAKVNGTAQVRLWT